MNAMFINDEIDCWLRSSTVLEFDGAAAAALAAAASLCPLLAAFLPADTSLSRFLFPRRVVTEPVAASEAAAAAGGGGAAGITRSIVRNLSLHNGHLFSVSAQRPMQSKQNR